MEKVFAVFMSVGIVVSVWITLSDIAAENSKCVPRVRACKGNYLFRVCEIYPVDYTITDRCVRLKFGKMQCDYDLVERVCD